MDLAYMKGDLVTLGKQHVFDVVAHGCNCFCTQRNGVAKHFDANFATANHNLYRLEAQRFRGDINKLGTLEAREFPTVREEDESKMLTVVNLYTQYRFGTDQMHADYDAIRLCMRKLNHIFKGKHIGLPKLGSGLAGGDWMIIERIIRQELKDCTVTIVEFEGKSDKSYQVEYTSN